MSKVKRFLLTAGIYLVGNALSKLIGFFLLPLYTSRLSPAQFGAFDLTATVITLSVPVIYFQVWDGMFRFAFEKNEVNEKYGIISNSFSIWTLGFIIYSLLFLLLNKALHFENSWLIFLYGVSVAIQYQYLFITRAFLKNKLFVMSGLINSIICAITNIFFIVKLNMGIESLYIAPLLGCAVQILIIEVVIHPLKNFNFREVKVGKLVEMVKFSVPLCISTILYWSLSGYTKVSISQQLGTHANGLYAVANRFCSMMTFIVIIFQYAWYEMAYFMAKDDERIAKYQKSIEYIFKVVLLGSGVFMIVSKLIFPYFVNPTYYDALMIMPLSLIGVAFNSFAGFIDTIFMAEKQTRWILKTTIAGACINIVSLLIFTPIWGLQGAIGALCIAFAFLVLFRIYVLNKMFSIKLQHTNFFYLLMLSAVVYTFYAVHNTLQLVITVVLLSIISVYCLRDILIPLWKSIMMNKR